MTEADLNLLRTYGPWILIAVMALRDLVPFLRDKLFPQVMDERKEESERRWLLNERSVKAHEDTVKLIGQMAVLLGTIDARTEVVANGMQRVEVIVTAINTRFRGLEQDTRPVPVETQKKARR